MNSIVLTTANSKTNDNDKLSLQLTSSMKLTDHEICLSHCSIYYNWRNFKSEYHNTELSYKYKSTKFDVVIPDGSYSVKDINNFIHYFMKSNKHTNDSGGYDINLYANPVYNRVTAIVGKDYELRLKRGLLDTLGFEGSQMPITNQQVNGDNVPELERVETVLVHCNLVQNQYQPDSSLIFSFVPNAPFGSLLHIKPNFPQWRKTREAQDIRNVEIWFTDQNYRPLDVEDKLLVELQIRKSN